MCQGEGVTSPSDRNTGIVPGEATQDNIEAKYGEFALKSFLDMRMDDETGLEPGTGVARLDIGPNHLNPNGVVHGGVLFTMVDTAMGKATMSVLDDGQFCASVEVQLRFIRPASEGPVTATATVLKRGRSIVHLQAEVTGEDDRLIATANGTFTIISFQPPS